VIMRGDTARPDGWESAEYELAPNPSCPVHGRKLHPLLEDEESVFGAGVQGGEGEVSADKAPSEDGEGSADGEAPGDEGTDPGRRTLRAGDA
jgi:hypothetical protein